MNLKTLTPELAVSPQISVDDVAAIKEAGFRSIICNRPDGEVSGQPAFSDVERAATEAGLTVRYIPVISGQLTKDNVDQFGVALGELDGPILAYCRSGTRCAMLWSLSQAGERTADDILGRTAAAGYDMSALMPHLQETK